MPPQKTYPAGPRTPGLTLYDDFLGEGVFESSSTATGILDYYSTDNPQAGENAIYWTGVNQYNAIGFDFKPNLNLSLLPENDYQLEFWVKGDSPGAKFDIRFVDTKSGTSDHPWRMGKRFPWCSVPAFPPAPSSPKLRGEGSAWRSSAASSPSTAATSKYRTMFPGARASPSSCPARLATRSLRPLTCSIRCPWLSSASLAAVLCGPPSGRA